MKINNWALHSALPLHGCALIGGAVEVAENMIRHTLDAWRRETINVNSPRTQMANRWFKFLTAIQCQDGTLVRLLIEEIDRDPNRVAMVLRHVTGADPTKRKNRGDWRKLGEDWKIWYQENKGTDAVKAKGWE